MNKFSRWIRSTQGLIALGGVVVLALVVAVVGSQFGWWGGAGTAGIVVVPAPSYPDPANGYTCLPTCAVDDAKFMVLAGDGQMSFTNAPVVIWITVPGNKTSFELGIFDGDTSKATDNTLQQLPDGRFYYTKGNWDDATDGDTTYTLYADPVRDGSGTTVIQSWKGNDVMPNNDWWTVTLNTDVSAKGPAGHYAYRLEATRPLASHGANAFKVRSTGYLSTGQDPKYAVGFVGMLANINDAKLIYPQWQSSSNPGSVSKYNGDWQFYFYLPDASKTVDLWDGDFDRGTAPTIDNDTKDPNAPPKPDWAVNEPGVTVESAKGGGIPPDNNNPKPHLKVGKSVKYTLINPAGQPLYENNDPSGTEEWEKFTISSDPAVTADLGPNQGITAPLPPGMYNIHVEGLDLHNYVWLAVNNAICPAGECPPPVDPEGFCPRTIGYWKNNINKVFVLNRTNGVQESVETLTWGLNNVSLRSSLFRKGINVQAPVAIGAPWTALTWEEANTILQRDTGNNSAYPGGKDQANTMLARALQQNLAAWMNMGTGKIGPTAWVVINTPSGTYEGTMLGALRTAEAIILANDQAKMEYAKDIADLINNGQINVDPPANIDSAGAPVCTIYSTVVPTDKQPPKHENMPKAPKPDVPKEIPPAQPPVCTPGNTYTVENPTNNPYYSVKFNYASGTEVKNGGYDTFQYTLPKDAVAALTQMQVTAKAATNERTVVLKCDFTDPLGCGDPVYDPDHLFGFQFSGATDNGDGTLTLTFQVFVFGDNGLSHAAFELPAGLTAGVPASYQAQSCIAP